MKIEEEIISRLLSVPGVEGVFPDGISLDTSKLKHVGISAKIINSSDDIDVHEVTITIKSDETVEYGVSGRIIMDSMLDIIDEKCSCGGLGTNNVVSVIYLNEFKRSNARKQLDMKFRVINNVEK